MLGRNGFAWGLGLHTHPATKQEGDGCSPAGLFELESVYGGTGTHPLERFPYRALTNSMEGIDDPKSRFYNRLVDTRKVKSRDWNHSEKVSASNPMFRWCVAVKHNWKQRPGAGSCIYLHIWKRPGVPTTGCTAMSAETLDRLVHSLDARKRPLLLQLPENELSKVALPTDLLALARPADS
jgi:L,D-peptidoglycan transpeptidase YkuD (ErfK/YbiS/YcfS/YnhG family)